jgi:HK97 family phage major capsid protein
LTTKHIATAGELADADLPTLRSARDQHWQRMRALLDAAEAGDRDLLADERRSYASHERQLEALGALIDARIDAAVEGGGGALTPAERVRQMRGTPAFGGGETARTCWLPSRSDYRSLIESRAVAASGNPFVPTLNARLWEDRLRAASVVLAAGPRILDVEQAGALRVPRITASVTVSATAENTTITPSDPTFGSVNLTPKKLAALTLCRNESLADSQPGLREVVAEDLIRQTATVLDQQFLTGSGSGANMTGLVNVSGVTAGPSLGANGSTPSLDNFAAMIASLEAANGDLSRAAWIMAPRSWATVRTLKDGQNRYQINPGVTGLEERSLFGARVFTTTNLPINGVTGTSNDTSTVILSDMSQVLVGCAKEIEVAYSEDYAFNADQTAIRVIARFDIGVSNAAAIVVMTGVRG